MTMQGVIYDDGRRKTKTIMTAMGTRSAIHDTMCQGPVPSRAARRPKTINMAMSKGMPHNRRKAVDVMMGGPPFRVPTRGRVR